MIGLRCRKKIGTETDTDIDGKNEWEMEHVIYAQWHSIIISVDKMIKLHGLDVVKKTYN